LPQSARIAREFRDEDANRRSALFARRVGAIAVPVSRGALHVVAEKGLREYGQATGGCGEAT